MAEVSPYKVMLEKYFRMAVNPPFRGIRRYVKHAVEKAWLSSN
jgi:hypothetical protein